MGLLIPAWALATAIADLMQAPSGQKCASRPPMQEKGYFADFFLSFAGEERLDVSEIVGRIDAGRKRLGRETHDDPMTVFERAQLFERLGAFEQRRRERGESAQEPRAIGIDADVAQER